MTTSAKSAKEESDRIILRHRDELQSELSAITARALAAEAALEAQVAALSAEPTDEGVERAARAICAANSGKSLCVNICEGCGTDAKAALTAFLRRRSQP
jgi:hypothetical protein